MLPHRSWQQMIAPLLVAITSGCQLVWDIEPDVDIVGGTCDVAKLATDSQNCGACRHQCGGGDCAGGVCQSVVLAEASGMPTDVAVDEQYVYWTSNDGKVGRVGKNGGEPETVVTGVQRGLARLTVDENRVYYREIEDASGVANIGAAAKDGASPFTVATNQPGIGSLTSDGSSLYWARTDDSNLGAIWHASFPAGVAQPVELIAGTLSFPQEVVTDGTSVFWGQDNNGYLMQVSSDGSGPTLDLGCGSDYITALAVDATNVYVARAEGKVVSTQKGDAASDCIAPSTRELATNMSGSAALGIALGGEYVVWTSPDLGEVSAIPKTGTCTGAGDCKRILAKGKRPTRIAADAKAAYWVDTGDGTIRKVAY
jgi:hypothetical protein